MNEVLRKTTAAFFLSAVIATSTTANGASFMPLGFLPGSDRPWSSATAISADGTVVVGWSNLDFGQGTGQAAFRWTASEGMVGLGSLPGGRPFSRSNGVSADGSVIVGAAESGAGQEAFRWAASEGMVGLGDLPGADFLSIAGGISGDGLVIVGGSSSAQSGPSSVEAFRWTEVDGMVALGDLPGSPFESNASSASADGAVIVGVGNGFSGSRVRGFRWTEADGMVRFGPADVINFARDVSANGDVIAGQTGSGVGETEAYRWTEVTGLVGLGWLPGDDVSRGRAISADGLTVVGSSGNGSSEEAFIWTNGTGMRSLADVLIEQGASGLEGWGLVEASGVSADGLKIVGVGINPSGIGEAWLAVIPVPGALWLFGSALGLLGWLRRRKVA